MDTFDFFRKLGAGAKFNFKRFGKDAERFKGTRSDKQDSSDQLAGVSFFGTETPLKSRLGEDEVSSKRKRTEAVEPVKPVKKKRKAKAEDVTSSDGQKETNGIQWTSQSNVIKAESKVTTSLKKLQTYHQQKVKRIRNQNRINVCGTDIPDPVSTFEELQKEYNIIPQIIQNIKRAGFQTPTPIQMQAIPLMMHDREVLACAPTGSGKTMAFCLPLLAHLRKPLNVGLRGLIISPTRELASQTHRELLKLSEGVGFRVQTIKKAKKFGQKLSKKFDILVTTPNRLIYLLIQGPSFVDLSRVEWLVVDESDKLFEDGKTGFREQLATIFLACSSPKIRRAFFSATFSPEVQQWCKLNLDNLVSVNIGPRNMAAETVEQELLFVGSESGKLVAMRNLIKKGFLPPVLVFVQSINRAQELFHELVYEGINVDVIHADRTQQQRDNVVTSFRSGKIWVLICTALMARGIDFKGVNLIINYDFPTTSIEYIHRIGRTGRAGHKGKAITFFTEDDKPLLRSIAIVMKRAGCPVPDYMFGFNKTNRKLKRQLAQKPPKRLTICTTPYILLKKSSAILKEGEEVDPKRAQKHHM